jgi:type IV pilus assembly protein PilQ
MRRLTFPVALLLLMTASFAAYAGSPRNKLQEIAVKEDPAATLIRISGSETPTFNVFRLNDPPRLFIDIAAGDIGAVDGTVEVFNGVVARVGTLSYNKAGSKFARVIVTFESDAPYDVSARGNDILVVVDAENRKLQDARPEALAKLEEAVSRERALLTELKQARAKEEKLVTFARDKRAEEEALQARIAEETRKAEALRAEAEQASLKALEEKELVVRSKAKATEEKNVAKEMEAIQVSRIAALQEEKLRLEEAREAAAKAAVAERLKQAAVEKAVVLARQARDAAEEERRLAEELKVAALDAAVKEKEKVELLRLQTRLESERKDALEKELADVVKAKEVALAQAIRLEKSKSGEIEEAMKAKVEALNAKLAAARAAVVKEEERKQALTDANQKEELRLAANSEAATRENERRNAEIARQLEDEALADAQRTAGRLEQERKQLEALVAKRQNEQTALASAQQDRAKFEAETRELEGRWEEQHTVVAKLKKERESKFKELAIAEADLVNQKNAVGQLRAQFELEKESLERMVVARKAEETKLAQLKAEALRVATGKKAIDNKKVATLNKELADKQGRLEAVSRKLAELENDYQRATTVAKTNEGRVTDLEEELAARKQDVAWLKGKYESLRGNLDEMRQEVAEKERAVSVLREEMKGKADSFKVARARYASAVEASEAKASMTEQQRQELTELKEKLSQVQEDRNRLERERTELSEQLSGASTEVARKEEANKLLSDKLTAAANIVQQLTSREKQARHALATTHEEKKHVEQELSTLAGTLERKSGELSRLERAFKTASAGKSKTEMAADAELTQLREEIAAATASLQQMEGRKTALGVRHEAVQEEASSLKGTVLALQQRVVDEESARKRLAAEKSAIEGKLADAGKELRQQKKKLTTLATRIEKTEGTAQKWKNRHEEALLQAQKEKSKRKELANKLKELNNQLERRNGDLSRYKMLYEEKVHQTSVVKARKGGVEERLAQREADLRAAQETAATARAESAEWQERFESVQSKLENTKGDLAKAKLEKQSVAAERRQMSNRVAQLEKEIVAARTRGTNEKELNVAQGKLKKARAEHDRLEKELAVAQGTASRVTDLENEIASVREAAKGAAAYKQELARTRSELAEARKAAVRGDAAKADVQKASELASTVKNLEEKLEQARTSKQQVSALKKQLKSAQKDARRVGSLEQKVARLEKYRKKASALESKVDEAKAAREDLARLQKALALEKKEASLQARELTLRLKKAEAEKSRLASQMKDEMARAKAEKSQLTAQMKDELARARADKSRLASKMEAELANAKADRSRLATEMETELAKAKADKSRLASKMETELANAQADKSRLASQLKEELARAKADKQRLVADLEKNRNDGVDSQLHNRLVSNLEEKEKEISELRQEVAKKEQLAQAAAAKRAATPAPPKKVSTRVTSVDFDHRSGLSTVELSVAGKPEFQVVEKSPTEFLLVLQDTTLLPVLERTLDTSEFDGAIRSISSYRSPTSPDTTIVSVVLAEPGNGKVKASADGIKWSFKGGNLENRTAVAENTPRTTPAKKSRAVAMYPEGVSAGGSQAGAGAGGAPMGGGGSGGLSPSAAGNTPFGIINPRPGKKKKKYTGRRINLSIKDADIQHVLAYLARVGGVNIVTNEGVNGKVSFYLEDVPWDLALDMILRASGLDYIKEQGIYRVAPVEDIQKEYEMALEKKKKLTELKQLQVKLIPVNYADAKALIKQIQPISSAKGAISVDARTNTLIVKDIEEHVQAIEDLVKRLDAQTPQVLIEARIVEASKDYTKDLGIQWGGSGQASPATANATGLIFPSSVGISGGASDASAVTLGLFTPANPNYAVNLPAPAGQGSGGAIGLTLGSLGGAANLSLRLSAAEEEGSVKIVSAPKISTIDNHKATIQQGISFPVSVVSAQGVNTQFFDAQLKMDVVPHVTQDGNIMLSVDIAKNEPDFSQTGANGNPTIRKKEAHTSLLLKDGDTTVIGGIYTRNMASSKKKVPFFADLPLVGSLFSSWSETDSRSELLIFVTPRIVNRQASRVRTEFE